MARNNLERFMAVVALLACLSLAGMVMKGLGLAEPWVIDGMTAQA